MTPPCKKCDHHVSTNADGLCGKCAPPKPLTTLDRVRTKYADDDRVTFTECGRSFELEHVEVGGRRIACLNETAADDAIKAIDAALSKPAPQLTRTEAIKAYCKGKAGVTIVTMAGGQHEALFNGKPLPDAYWNPTRDADPAEGNEAAAIIARIDAALAKPTPAQAVECASTRCTKARVGIGPFCYDCARGISARVVSPAQAVEAATTVFDAERVTDGLRSELDHIRRSQSLALDHVVRLRGVSARLVEALDLMTELLREAP